MDNNKKSNNSYGAKSGGYKGTNKSSGGYKGSSSGGGYKGNSSSSGGYKGNNSGGYKGNDSTGGGYKGGYKGNDSTGGGYKGGYKGNDSTGGGYKGGYKGSDSTGGGYKGGYKGSDSTGGGYKGGYKGNDSTGGGYKGGYKGNDSTGGGYKGGYKGNDSTGGGYKGGYKGNDSTGGGYKGGYKGNDSTGGGYKGGYKGKANDSRPERNYAPTNGRPYSNDYKDRKPAFAPVVDQTINTPQVEEELPENVLEGRNPVREALKAGREIEKILIIAGETEGSLREIVKKAREKKIIIQETDRHRLDAISVSGAHQGIIAYVAAKPYVDIDEIFDYAKEKGEDPFIMLLDGICDPQNLGSIIRTAECAGVHGIIIPKRRAVGLTPIVAKTSAGAIEYMRVAKVTNISSTIEQLQKRGVWVFGADMNGESYVKTNLTGPIALVIGAEGEGVSELVKKRCDRLIAVPMLGNIESLNASVSAGIIMYECIRQRVKK